jgi:hypothetical protein
MRVSGFVITTMLVAGLSGNAMAQSAANPPVSQTAIPTYGATDNPEGWLASGFVGSSFGGDTDDASLEFGGQIAYMWGGIVGAEFLFDWAPTFQVSEVEIAQTGVRGNIFGDVLLDGSPSVNTQMFNLITGIPVGSGGQFKPYVSAGWGRVAMRTDVFELNLITPGINPIVADGSSSAWGGNLGFGVVGFGAGNVGVRGDVRYFKVPGNDDSTLESTTAADLFTENLLAGLNFWRANIGVAFKW